MRGLRWMLLGALVMVGCDSANKPTPANYLTALNAYLPDHPDCLLDGSMRFPYETSDAKAMRPLSTLVTAGVLTGEKDPALPVTRYALTDAGQRAGQHLCYGHRVATGIVSSTVPAMANGFNETQIVYSYRMEDAPIWAKDAAVEAAYPKLGAAMSGSATGTVTLAQTGVGWEVPD